jgi:glycosyltransferase involved in cell wall biosynthesis
MMRIAVDARTIYSPRRRGTGKNLIDLYTTLASLRRDWEFLMLHQAPTEIDPFARVPNVHRQRIDIWGDRVNAWQDIRLPIAAWAAGATVLHCPANTAPYASRTPIVLTIHDLIPLEIDPESTVTRRWITRVGRSARRARQILTPSDYTRTALVARMGVDHGRVTVNHWAPDRGLRPADASTIADVRARYGLPSDASYLLAFGAEDPRKNTTGIIEAWARVPDEIRRTARMLIVGIQPTSLPRLSAFAQARVRDASCLLHGFAAEDDIAPLLSGATALCYPSRHEGFGLPVVDAFACGTPVITSRTTSLPEVAGDAALLVDPEDVDDIAEALIRVLSCDRLRDHLRDAGRRRLPLFSWERCARTAAAALEAAA